MKYIDDFRSPAAAEKLICNIKKLSMQLNNKPIQIMEVCGSHTMAITRYGIQKLLPNNIDLISGPGCPVCVTPITYVNAAIELAVQSDTIIATFGDMVNIPGTKTTLREATSSKNNKLEVCYSPLSAITLAETHPDKEIVFLAIGFETTIPLILSLLNITIQKNIKNLSLLVSFKTIPPALNALTSDPEVHINAFLCPAHVSAIIGSKAYEPFVETYKIPCVIAGFEPLDILYGIEGLLKQLIENSPKVENQYNRVVKYNGNKIAQNLIKQYLSVCDANWRGMGIIPKSGLRLKDKYSQYDALKKFNIEIKSESETKKCKCGDILKGKLKPYNCPLFKTDCNPTSPVGPCMISSQGACAAYYKFH